MSNLLQTYINELKDVKNKRVLNRLLYKNNNNKFISIHKFNKLNSDNIKIYLETKSNEYDVYLSDKGSLVVYKKNTNQIIFSKYNKITKFFENSIIKNKEKKLKIYNIISSYYLFSNNSKFCLYRYNKVENNVNNTYYEILYNIFYGKDFLDYYKTSNNGRSVLYTMNNYCNIIKDEDVGCSCLNLQQRDICLEKDLGINLAKSLKNSNVPQTKSAYGYLRRVCPCVYGNCRDFRTQFNTENSLKKFIDDNHEGCKGNYSITYCNTIFDIGKNISKSSINLQQRCSDSGFKIDQSGNIIDTPTPIATKINNDDNNNDNDIINFIKNNKYIIISSILLLLLLIILLI